MGKEGQLYVRTGGRAGDLLGHGYVSRRAALPFMYV